MLALSLTTLETVMRLVLTSSELVVSSSPPTRASRRQIGAARGQLDERFLHGAVRVEAIATDAQVEAVNAIVMLPDERGQGFIVTSRSRAQDGCVLA
jgi:hypothetical protein